MAHLRHNNKVRLRSGGTLFRRASTWWVDFTVGNTPRTRCSLETSDQKLAKEKAEMLVASAHRGELEKAQTAMGIGRAAAMSLLDVCRLYEAAARVEGISHRTIHHNVLTLKRLALLGTGKEPGDTSLADLDKVAMTRARTELLRNVPEDMRKRRDRTIASTMRQARCVFGDDYLHLYGRLPDGLRGWLEARHKAEAKKYEIPPELLRERTHAAAATWGEAAKKDGRLLDRQMRVAYLLCYRLGMRPGEAATARWDWLEADGRGGTALRVSYKRRTRRIPVSPALLEELRALGDDTFLLPGAAPRSDRETPEGIRMCFIVIGPFAQEMRRLGWDKRAYPKAAYELRKLAGSRWYTELGAERAAALLGHGNVAVTCQFYAALDRPISAADVDGVFLAGEARHG